MPDHKLLALAKSGELEKPDVLKAQVRRMLADSRSEALVSNFTQQWLGIRRVKMLDADEKLFPAYNLSLQNSMIGESEAFFREILEKKLPLTTFLDPDFASARRNHGEALWHTRREGNGIQKGSFEATFS